MTRLTRVRQGAKKSNRPPMSSRNLVRLIKLRKKLPSEITVELPLDGPFEFKIKKTYMNDQQNPRGEMYVPKNKNLFARLFSTYPNDFLHVSIFYDKPEEMHLTFEYDKLKVHPDDAKYFLHRFAMEFMKQMKSKLRTIDVVEACGLRIKNIITKTKIGKNSKISANRIRNTIVQNVELISFLNAGAYAEQNAQNKKSLNLLNKLYKNPMAILTQNEKTMLSLNYPEISKLINESKKCHVIATLKLGLATRNNKKVVNRVNERLGAKPLALPKQTNN